MKPRLLTIHLFLTTDIPLRLLRDKRRWQALLDRMHDDTKDPLADYAIVENVAAYPTEEQDD